ncbi:MAG TPA: pyridoxine 5'-phosphate synthase [Thermodesulfobacteriota bacterium]
MTHRRLSVNIDHVATVRQARRDVEPDPVHAAVAAELGGADGITVHLREDRRHIQDRDVRILRETVRVELNLEMANTDEMVGIARQLRPDLVTLVPERREELTTEGGLDVIRNEAALRATVETLSAAGIPVSLFVDADRAQLEAAARTGARFVELHTGRYAHERTEAGLEREASVIASGAAFARAAGLRVNVGHGLTYRNVGRIAAIPELETFAIGHNIVARALLVGMAEAVREMKALIVVDRR